MKYDLKNKKGIPISAEEQTKQLIQQRKRIEQLMQETQEQSKLIAKLMFPTEDDAEDEVIEEGINVTSFLPKAKL